MRDSLVLFWSRRDLRLHDNKALFQALNSGQRVLPLFIFDDEILKGLPFDDHRIGFIYGCLEAMQKKLVPAGKGMLVRRGRPMDVLREIVSAHPVKAVYCHADHEPHGRKRDEAVRQLLENRGIRFLQSMDHLIREPGEVLKDDGKPYHVFTPYSKKWKTLLSDAHLIHYPSEEHLDRFSEPPKQLLPSLDELGFRKSTWTAPSPDLNEYRIRHYHLHRDYPAREGTTRLGVHLRFGTLSIREVVRKAVLWNEAFLNELIWREFYAMILWHYPHVVSQAFKPAYDRISWRNEAGEFERWKQGQTGFPLVDAGMRQLASTGYMHNRLRMLTASFLSKHLLIDWRLGEAWFAEKLFDYELSSNNGGWQWSAGSGCDAAPYFRVFNPLQQAKKFDPGGAFVRAWVPEATTPAYPRALVDLSMARQRCLQVYKEALNP